MTSPLPARAELRRRLLEQRQAWVLRPEAVQAQRQLETRVLAVLDQLEPQCLGLYWPVQGEFNPRPIALPAQSRYGCVLALPFAQKAPVAMHYRLWDGGEPSQTDECGLHSTNGRQIVPDVLLVPCVGFSKEGWRLGYGGGFFDRFMAAHPGVTALGVAWENAQIDLNVLAPRDHDSPLVAVLTENNIWST